MTGMSNAIEEIRRSPVAAISGAVGALIAAASLLLAWIQHQSVVSVNTSSAPVTPGAMDFNLANILVVIAFFVGITVFTAICLRTVARKHDLGAFLASIPLVALTNFSTVVVVYLAPPRSLSQSVFASAHDLIFYASAAIVITFCGPAVLRDLLKLSSSTEKKTDQSEVKGGDDAGGLIFFIVFVLVVWGWLVFAGQTRLTRTFLPDIAHPIEIKPAKAGA